MKFFTQTSVWYGLDYDDQKCVKGFRVTSVRTFSNTPQLYKVDATIENTYIEVTIDVCVYDSESVICQVYTDRNEVVPLSELQQEQILMLVRNVKNTQNEDAN